MISEYMFMKNINPQFLVIHFLGFVIRPLKCVTIGFLLLTSDSVYVQFLAWLIVITNKPFWACRYLHGQA